MSKNSIIWDVTNWIFSTVFFVIGVLNLVLVHAIPGLFYIVIAFLYFPPASVFLRKIFHFATPPVIKVILVVVILWATLAVGDLMELFESWLCNCESLP